MATTGTELHTGDGADSASFSPHVHSFTGGGGGVDSVTAGDTSIVVGGTSGAPTIETSTLDVIATDHPAAADWSNNSHKITSLANGSSAQDAAAFGQIPTGVALLAGATFTGPLVPKVVTLTDASTITVNAALGNDFRVTIAASRTMGAPSGPADGQMIKFQITQGGAGSFGITWNSVYDFGTTGAPTLTTAAGNADIIGFVYNATLVKWCCAGSALGF